MTDRLRLIHWNSAEAERRAWFLIASGYEVDWQSFVGPASLRELRDDPPAAVVIDPRLPSQGRDVALSIRQYKTTRRIPLVFTGGDPEKVRRIHELLPDALYTNWEEIPHVLKDAVNRSPQEFLKPASIFAGYARAPLAKKLGIKPGTRLLLVDAPPEILRILGELPQGVILTKETLPAPDITLWFCQSGQELESKIVGMAELGHKGGLWIIWPKKTSAIKSDLSQPDVRKIGLATGLVDFKVCSIDETWTGLRFTRRKP